MRWNSQLSSSSDLVLFQTASTSWSPIQTFMGAGNAASRHEVRSNHREAADRVKPMPGRFVPLVLVRDSTTG